MRLLFTGGGGAASECLPRLLPQHEVFFVDADPLVGVHVLPAGNNPAFGLQAAKLCRELEIDLLIPGVDEELRPLAMQRQWGAFPCKLLLPSYEFVGIHLDKLESMKRMKAMGIPVPQTWRYGMVKPREGRGSTGVQVVGHRDGMIVQELLDGQEFTVTMVADQKQRLRAIVPVRVDQKKGVTIQGQAVHDDEVMAACWQIHLAMPTSGVYNVQCMKTERGVFPFEINPRVSTTTCLAIASGVDVIRLALDESESVSAMLAPFVEMKLRRRWQNEFEVAA